MRTITAHGITWLDIQKPKLADRDKLKEEYALHPFIVQQFLPPIHRPKIEEYSNQLFMVLHFPVYNSKSCRTKLVELDMIITPNTLITSHDQPISELDTFFNDCKLQDYHQNQYFKSSGHLLFGVLNWLIDSCLPMLDHISETIEKIENEVFEGKEKEMLMEIALAKRDIIEFRRAIKPQRSVLEVLAKKALRFFGTASRALSQEAVGSIIRVWNVLENHRELINSIEQTNNSLLSHKLSDIMKFLTVVSFITFPLSIIVGFFGMNVFQSIPMVRENPYSWVIIIMSMVTVTTVMIIYFQKKKWL